MGPITQELYKQIKGWRIYSVLAPAGFSAIAAFMYIHHGTPWQTIFYTGLIILSVTCISWWHWSLSTMVTMLAIMKDTDDHFKSVDERLHSIQKQVSGKPSLFLVKPLDNDK